MKCSRPYGAPSYAQVLRDMDALRKHSAAEMQRREAEWEGELQIWQQLVAEKEQQVVAAERRGGDALQLTAELCK